MDMQGWPLYAAGVGTGRVFAVVGWERPTDSRFEQPHAVGVELNEDVATAPYVAHPYAVDLTSELDGADVVVGSGEREMRFAAGWKNGRQARDDQEAVELLRMAMRLRTNGAPLLGGTEAWHDFMTRASRYLRTVGEGQAR